MIYCVVSIDYRHHHDLCIAKEVSYDGLRLRLIHLIIREGVDHRVI